MPSRLTDFKVPKAHSAWTKERAYALLADGLSPKQVAHVLRDVCDRPGARTGVTERTVFRWLHQFRDNEANCLDPVTGQPTAPTQTTSSAGETNPSGP